MAEKKYYDSKGNMVRRVKVKDKDRDRDNDKVRAGERSRDQDRAKAADRNERVQAEENPNLIIGRNPVMEALKSGRTVDKLMILRDGEGSVRKIAVSYTHLRAHET